MKLTQGEKMVWAAAFTRVIGEEPYGGQVTYKTNLTDAHRIRRDRAVSAGDDAVENLRAAVEAVENEYGGFEMLRAMLED